MLTPSSSMETDSAAPGISSWSRLSDRRNVDLPQPEGPMRAVTRLACISRDTRSSTLWLPNQQLTSFATRGASPTATSTRWTSGRVSVAWPVAIVAVSPTVVARRLRQSGYSVNERWSRAAERRRTASPQRSNAPATAASGQEKAPPVLGRAGESPLAGPAMLPATSDPPELTAATAHIDAPDG